MQGSHTLAVAAGLSLVAASFTGPAPAVAQEGIPFSSGFTAPRGWPGDLGAGAFCAEVRELALDEADGLALEHRHILALSRTRERPVSVVAAVVDAPAMEIVAAIEDFGRYPQMTPVIARGEATWAAEGGIAGTGEIALPGPLPDLDLSLAGGTVSYAGPAGETWQTHFSALPEGSSVRSMAGCWSVEPYDEDGARSLVTFGIVVDLGTPMPGMVVSWAAGRALPELIMGLRAEVERR